MQKDLFQFIKSFLIFLPIAALFYIIGVCAWGELNPNYVVANIHYKRGASGHMNSRLTEVKNVKNIDILFLGSSHTYRGFDNRNFSKLGYSSFNLGSGSQTPIQTELLLNRYLDQLSPSIVFYEVYPKTFEIDGVESAMDIISNDDNDCYSYEMIMDLNNIKAFNTYIYARYREILGRNSSLIEPLKHGPDTYLKGGYVERELSYYTSKNKYNPQKWVLREEQLAAFSRIQEQLKAKGCRVVLVQSPIIKSLYESYSNNMEFDEIMLGYGEYYNFNTSMTLNDSLHFYDKDHLNQNGVNLFNQELIDTVLKK